MAKSMTPQARLRSSFRRYAAAIAAALVLASPASAHRVGVPVTTIVWSEQSQTWDIMHRLSVHDVDQHFSGSVSGDDLYATPEGQATLGDYVSNAFQIKGHDLDLKFVGTEVDADQLWVYFELKAPPQTVEIESNILFGDGATSFTVVNVKGSGGTQSLMFRPHDHPKSAQLVPPGG
jgi:hypothetical protein